MKPLVLYVVSLSLLAACGTRYPTPTDMESYVGVYVYKSMDNSFDKPTDHEFDRLTLKRHGMYDLVQGGSTKAKSVTKGSWHLVPGMEGLHIELGHAAYPIEVTQDEIRLIINNDLPQWYVKAR